MTLLRQLGLQKLRILPPDDYFVALIFPFMNVDALSNDLPVQTTELKKAALVFRAVNHHLRQQIVRLLHQNGKMTVTQVYTQLNLEQPVASQHLAILRKAGFVSTVRGGRCIYYFVNYVRLAEIHRSGALLLAHS